MRQTNIILLALIMSALSATAIADDKTKKHLDVESWSFGISNNASPSSGGQNQIKTDDSAGAQAAEKPKPKPKPSGGSSLPLEDISMNYGKIETAPKQQPDNLASPQKPKQGLLVPAVQAAREAAKR
jgi:hypothetical protein